MDETLRQLGELLLRSIPTVFFFLFVYFGYRALVHKPLMKVLAERYAKTQGAIERARADIAAAEAKTAEYEQRLRESKLAVFKAQEARRLAALSVKSEILSKAREQANARIVEAKKAIEGEAQVAKSGLQGEAERMATEIIRVVLKPMAVASSPAGGAR